MKEQRYSSVGTVSFTVRHHEEEPTEQDILLSMLARYLALTELVFSGEGIEEEVGIEDTVDEEVSRIMDVSYLFEEPDPESGFWSYDYYGKKLGYKDFMDVAMGNETYARMLRNRVEQEGIEVHPSTLLNDDIMHGEVGIIDGVLTLTGGEQDG